MSLIKYGVFFICAAVAPWAFAQSATDYPTRAIEIVVPYPAGGPNDVIARLLGDQMSKTLGQSVVIRNMPGAGGNVATAAVARAEPDGYTLILPAMAYAVNPALFKEVNYRFEDFEPVSMVASGPLILVTHPDLGFKTVQDLIDAAKAEPGKLEYASGGVGTSLHLAAELFQSKAGVKMLHVPYKGTGALMPDLLAGRVGVLFSSPLTVRQHIEQGSLVALGVTSETVVEEWKGIPSISDTVPDYEMAGWYSLMAPAGVPDEILDKLNAAVRSAQESQGFMEKMYGLGVNAVKTTREEARAYIDAEVKKWSELVKEAGIVAN